MSGPAAVDWTGYQHGSWTVLERDWSRRKGTYWRARCACGHIGSLFAGDIRRGLVLACRTCASRARRAAVPTYKDVHRWVKAERGPARNYRCHCGKQATQWAYDHTDPNPMQEWVEGSNGKRWLVDYSPDTSRYTPMCTAHHHEFDRGRGRTVEEAA